MQKKYTSLGLMSGTSGDGVDASIINSNGVNEFESIKDKFYEYDNNTFRDIHEIKEKINSKYDLIKFISELNDLERRITLFHAKIVNELAEENKEWFIGFHGQTIYHNSLEKISKQLGDAKLLHQLTKNKIFFNFRKNDILNGGEGAPLTPLYHQLIVLKKKIDLPVCVLNIGGISNITIIKKSVGYDDFSSKDIGPGNCLIDSWIRKNTNKKFDIDGNISMSGKKNEIILEQAQELYANRLNKNKLSFDVGDFDISFARGLSLQDGAATLTEFTANIISEALIKDLSQHNVKKILLCGGGRKNLELIKKIKKNLSNQIQFELIDEYKIDGDFIESQAFAFFAIRSHLNLPISFPNTTGCNKACTGGELIEN